MQPDLAPVLTQNKIEILSVAEALIPISINAPIQTNNANQSNVLLIVTKGKETVELGIIKPTLDDLPETNNSQELSGSNPKATFSGEKWGNAIGEMDATRRFWANKLTKLKAAVKETEEQELLANFFNNTMTSAGAIGKPSLAPKG